MNCFQKLIIFFFFYYRELSFRKGDTIYLRRQIDKNWFEGEHNAMIGLLPSNYVEVSVKAIYLIVILRNNWDKIEIVIIIFFLDNQQ